MINKYSNNDDADSDADDEEPKESHASDEDRKMVGLVEVKVWVQRTPSRKRGIRWKNEDHRKEDERKRMKWFF